MIFLFSFILFFAADTSVDTAALARAVFCARVDDDVSAGAEAAEYLSGLAGSLSRELDWEKRNLVEARAIRASLETEAAEKAGVARCSDAPQAVAAVVVAVTINLINFKNEIFFFINKNSPSAPAATPAAAVDNEIDRLSATFGDLIGRLIAFVERYFPTPERAPPARRRGGGSGSGGGSGGGELPPYTPLKKLLEALMNACVDTPADPYVRITEAHFPPHVELLVRAGVAQRHAGDAGLIMLTEFHK
jgi:hypothetical protein